MDKLFYTFFAALSLASVFAGVETSERPLDMYYKSVELICGRNAQGEPCKKDYSVGISLIEKVLSATDGVVSNAAVRADALYLLGYCYANGFGVTSNSLKAVQAFHDSGTIGKCWAIADEAMCYFEGMGVAKDERKAVALLKKAVEYGADSNKAIADNFEIETGKMFADRDGEKNFTLAYEAKNNLALCYMMGIGCTQDDARAAELLNIPDLKFGSAEDGLLAAYYLFRHGDKVRANDILLDGIRVVYKHNIGAANRLWGVGQWNKSFVFPGEKILSDMDDEGMIGAMGQSILRLYAGDHVKRDVNHAMELLKRVYDRDKKLGGNLVEYLCKISADRFPCEVDGLIDSMSRSMPNDNALFGRIGHLFLEGKILKHDAGKAIEYISIAAKGGDCDAQMDYGCCYECGIGVNTNLTEAAKWYKKAADNGNVFACQNYGLALIQGRGLDADITNGVAYVEKGAVGGDGLAQLTYGTYCLYGNRGVKKDIQSAIEWLSKAAANGRERAYYHLGLAYCEEPACDIFSALEWLLKARKVNDKRAEEPIGNIVTFCKGAPKFEVEKFSVYKTDAEAGDDWAQYLYAKALYSGLGCETNIEKALEWAMKSARQGNRDGVNLVSCCLFDMGDVENGRKWMDGAIRRGSSKAMFNKGMRYFYGKDGFSKDMKEAFRYIEIAAMCGNVSAMGRQAAMLYFGEGVEQSKENGLLLMKRAADLGDEYAEKGYKMLKREER